jgi:hypothetical protein
VDGLQRLSVQAVEPPATVSTNLHRTDLSQDAQMLGDLRLREAELGDEVVDGTLAVGEEIQDLPPPRLRYGVEGIRGRGCPCHIHNLYLYRNMSIRSQAPGFGDEPAGQVES